MSGADDEEAGRRRSRFRKRERVTLKWRSPPLALPGESDEPEAPTEGAPDADPSAPPVLEAAELELPRLDGPEPQDGPGAVPRAAAEPAADGWDRQSAAGAASGSGPVREAGAKTAAGAGPDGGALSLVDQRSRPSSPGLDLAAEMNDRYALGDYTAALRAAELILGSQPDHPEARRVSEGSRERLVQLYGSRLGSLKRTPRPAVEGAEVRWLGLDHRAGFLLSRVDGAHTLEELLDVSGMPRLEALKTLVELLDLGAIRLSD
jgi:hypothetical protein